MYIYISVARDRRCSAAPARAICSLSDVAGCEAGRSAAPTARKL